MELHILKNKALPADMSVIPFHFTDVFVQRNLNTKYTCLHVYFRGLSEKTRLVAFTYL